MAAVKQGPELKAVVRIGNKNSVLRGSDAYNTIVMVLRRYLRSLAPTNQPLSIPHDTPVFWLVNGDASNQGSGMIQLNYDIVVKPPHNGKLAHGSIEMSLKGKPCGCQHRA
jgi:hypothetical protein